jgi:hypothetical protein
MSIILDYIYIYNIVNAINYGMGYRFSYFGKMVDEIEITFFLCSHGLFEFFFGRKNFGKYLYVGSVVAYFTHFMGLSLTMHG